jgi:hypothetical protein
MLGTYRVTRSLARAPGSGGMTLTLSGDTGRVVEVHASSNLTA